MNIRCFLQTRFSQTLFNKTLCQVLVLKHSAEPFKHSDELYQHSAELLKKKLCRVFRKLGELFEKLGRLFKNLGRAFVLQYNPCSPGQPQYSTPTMLANIVKAKVHTNVFNAAFLYP